jgi:hypothetical protein
MILKKFARCDSCGITEDDVAMVHGDDCGNCGVGTMKIIVAVDCENPGEATIVENALLGNFANMQKE